MQTVKKGLKRSESQKGTIQEKLDNFMFAQRNTPSPNTGYTPSELFIGRRLKSRLDLIRPHKKEHEECMPETNRKRVFNKNQKVFVRNHSGRGSMKWVPATIVREVGTQCYEVDTGDKVVKGHVDHILKNNTSNTTREIPEHDYLFDPTDDDNPEVDNGNLRRYPTRLRRPVQRYGYSPRYFRT